MRIIKVEKKKIIGRKSTVFLYFWTQYSFPRDPIHRWNRREKPGPCWFLILECERQAQLLRFWSWFLVSLSVGEPLSLRGALWLWSWEWASTASRVLSPGPAWTTSWEAAVQTPTHPAPRREDVHIWRLLPLRDKRSQAQSPDGSLERKSNANLSHFNFLIRKKSYRLFLAKRHAALRPVDSGAL